MSVGQRLSMPCWTTPVRLPKKTRCRRLPAAWLNLWSRFMQLLISTKLRSADWRSAFPARLIRKSRWSLLAIRCRFWRTGICQNCLRNIIVRFCRSPLKTKDARQLWRNPGWAICMVKPMRQPFCWEPTSALASSPMANWTMARMPVPECWILCQPTLRRKARIAWQALTALQSKWFRT